MLKESSKHNILHLANRLSLYKPANNKWLNPEQLIILLRYANYANRERKKESAQERVRQTEWKNFK